MNTPILDRPAMSAADPEARSPTEMTSPAQFGLSAIICTYNRKGMAERAVNVLLAQTPASIPFEIVLVDNGSSDGTAALGADLERSHSEVRYVFEPAQGLSNARNRGARTARYEYLIYLDDDAFAKEGYLDALTAAVGEHEPDLFGGPIYPDYVDGQPAWFPNELEVREKLATSGFSSSVTLSGGNFGIRRSVLDRLGGFNPKFGMSGSKVGMLEERLVIDAYRNQTPLAQQKVYYCVEASLLHHTPLARMRLRFQAGRLYIANYQFTSYQLKDGVRNHGAIRKDTIRRLFYVAGHGLGEQFSLLMKGKLTRLSLYKYVISLVIAVAKVRATMASSVDRRPITSETSAAATPAPHLVAVQLVLSKSPADSSAFAGMLTDQEVQVRTLDITGLRARAVVQRVIEQGVEDIDIIVSETGPGLRGALAVRMHNPTIQLIHRVGLTGLQRTLRTDGGWRQRLLLPFAVIDAVLTDRRNFRGADELIVSNSKVRRYLSRLVGGGSQVVEFPWPVRKWSERPEAVSRISQMIARARLWARKRPSKG